MTQRITIRLDEGLSTLINTLRNKQIYNISGLIREALNDKLEKMNIDKSGEGDDYKKDDEIH
jgi:Arc/MetJ-type ribon-helix-helix transcriptional regulator